jgi:hypothetical protein
MAAIYILARPRTMHLFSLPGFGEGGAGSFLNRVAGQLKQKSKNPTLPSPKTGRDKALSDVDAPYPTR